jgi:ADP-heptose:LPS heptosyltransferase
MIAPIPAKPRRILIVALDNLGDLVFSSALVPPLAQAFPDATIDVWSKAYTADCAKLIPHVSNVIAADPFFAPIPHHPRAPMRPFLQSIADIRRRNYELALVTNAPWRTAAAVAATRIPVRIGRARNHNQHFLTHVLPRENPARSVLGEQAGLLEPLGVTSTDPRYLLDADRLGSLRGDVARLLPERFVALHPFAGNRARCVPLTEWAQIAFALHGRGLSVLWVGTTAELNELRTSHTHPHGYYVDQVAQKNLGAAAAALSLATLFVGHDSGPLHVAGAFGVPVLGIYAPGQPLRTYPQGVGPARMLAHSGPAQITARMLLREMEALLEVSAS